MSGLRILHVIPSLSLKRGGPSVMIRTLTQGLAVEGVDVTVVTTDDDGPDRSSVQLGSPHTVDGVTTMYFARTTSFYTVSRGLYRWLGRNVGNFDVVHTHATFGFPTFAAARWARRRAVPYVVRPLGTLNPWGVTEAHPRLKKISLRFVERPLLDRAGAVHFGTEHERKQAARVWTGDNSVVIPNPVPAATPGDRKAFRKAHPEIAGRRIVLYLSRIHESKGLDLLLPAISSLEDAVLVIAGDGEPSLIASLKARAAELGIEGQVLWTGMLTGDDKRDALAAADVFVLPSYSESFGVAVVEAMSAGLPVVVTDQVAVRDEVTSAGAGVVTGCDPKEIAGGLQAVLSSVEVAREMGARGKQRAEDRFSVGAVSSQLIRLYEELASPRR